MYRLCIKYSSHVYLIVFDYYVSYVGVHIVIEMKQMPYRSKYKYTPVASYDAERSFPAYKLILTDKRQQLTCKYRKIARNLWRSQSQWFTINKLSTEPRFLRTYIKNKYLEHIKIPKAITILLYTHIYSSCN